MIRPFALAGALLATTLTFAAVAPVSAAPTSVRISYADLDLTSAAGRATFDARVRQAAGRLCASAELRDLSRVSACRSGVIEDASAALAARHVSTVVASL